MHVQIITYKLTGIDEADYQRLMVQPDAPILATVPGLISKVWLSRPEAKSYGGVYLWRSKTDMAAFMASDLVKEVVSRPFVKDVHSEDYAVAEEPSRITRGIAA